jgi:hypothetical protein
MEYLNLELASNVDPVVASGVIGVVALSSLVFIFRHKLCRKKSKIKPEEIKPEEIKLVKKRGRPKKD